MKYPNLKRWLFIALLLALLAGTVVGHVHAIPVEYLCADQRHGASRNDSPFALQQRLGEVAKRKLSLENGASEEVPVNFPFRGLLPLNILFLARP